MGYGSIKEIFNAGLSADALQKAVTEFYAEGTKASYNSGKKKNTEDYSDFENSLDSNTASEFGSNFKAETLGPLQDAKTAIEGRELARAIDKDKTIKYNS